MAGSDSFYRSLEFQNFFKGATRSLILKANAPTFTVLAASDRYLSLTHKNREEVLENGLFITYPGAHSDPNEKYSVFSSFMRVIESRKTDELPVFKYEITVGDTDSRETHYWTNVNEPIFDEDGNVAYIINTTTNITDQVRQQNAIEESESRFRLMAEGTEVMIAVGDETGKAVYFNRPWEVATGRSSAELMEFGWVDLMHPEDRNKVMRFFTSALDKKEPWVLEFRMPAGTEKYRWLMARGTPRFTTDGNFVGYISSAVDITDQKEHQQHLAKLNENLYAINEELTAINEELQEAQTELVFANSQLASSEQELINSKTRLEESEHLLKMAIQSSGLGIWVADLTSRTLALSERGKEMQGIPPDVELSLDESFSLIDELDQSGVKDAIAAAVKYHGSFVTDYKINTYDVKSVKWLRASGIVQRDEADRPMQILGTILDITDQKLNEQRKNDFISMVSHELKTPLTSINGYVQILQNAADKKGDLLAASLLGKTSKQVGKMTTLINGFLNVSKLEAAKIHIERTKFDMAELLAELEEEALTSITSHQIVFAPVGEILVMADRDKIGQVINNLITNAVKYSPAGTTINVSCLTDGDWARLSVRDEGYGIKADNLPKIFQRYYRVEDGLQGISGFGIGLYLCYEIVKRHDGDIWAESIVGEGSTFHFTLPLLGLS